MTKIVTTPNAAATQTEHPWRATARTFVQNITGTALAILGILIFVPGAMDTLAGILAELGLVLPASIILLPPLIARFMAIPGVERALRKIGLGAAPNEHYLPDDEVFPDEIDDSDWYVQPDEDSTVDAEAVDDLPELTEADSVDPLDPDPNPRV